MHDCILLQECKGLIEVAGEAPLVYTATSIAGSISQVRDRRFGRLLFGHFRHTGKSVNLDKVGGLFGNQRNQREFVSIGASAGVCCARIYSQPCRSTEHHFVSKVQCESR